jgi:cell shape-determining protein MreC
MENTKLLGSWKKKALERRLTIKFLKQRVKELLSSRDRWKKKALDRGDQVKSLEEENKALKKSLLSPGSETMTPKRTGTIFPSPLSKCWSRSS